MRFVPVRVKRPAQGTRALVARVVLPGHEVFASWVSPNAPLGPGVFTAFRDKAHKAYEPARDAAATTAMAVDGALIVRRSRAEPALADLVRAGSVVLRPVMLSSAVAGPRPALDKPVLEDDWALVHVLERFPIDRSHLGAPCFDVSGAGKSSGAYDPTRPHASLVSSRPDVLVWTPGREPTAPTFRLHELPIDLFLREDVLSRLNDALGGALEEGRSRPNLGMLDETTNGPPFALDEGTAKEAALAFYRLLGGKPETGDRERALANPIHAYLTARLVDRQPAGDTRRAACGHPFYAAAYARDVDVAPRDDTRDAAAKAEAPALEYMRYVDRGPHPRTRATFASSYRAHEYEIEAARVAAAAKAVEAHALAPEPQAETSSGAKPTRRKQVRAAAKTFTPLLMKGPKRGEVYLIAPGAPDQQLAPAADPGPAGVVAMEPTPKGARHLRKRIASLVALGRSDLAPFVLRRGIAESVLGHLLPVFPTWSVGPEIPQMEAAASASAAAYYELAAGDGGAGRRSVALASPIYGYWVARNADTRPADDTRAAAIMHPHYAALYARWVDRAPRDDTRSAAATDAASALFYAKFVDVGLTLAIEKTLLASGWGPEDLRVIAADLKRVRSAGRRP